MISRNSNWVSKSIYKFSLFFCLFVCIKKNVKTAEPLEPIFCMGPHVTLRKVYKYSQF